MPSNAQKLPLARSLNAFATRRALDVIQQLGRALPCRVTARSGSIVTVKFDVTSTFALPNVTLPVAMSEFARAPLPVGTAGVTLPADAYLGAISGLGGGTPDLSLPGNLSALVFVPVSSASWTPPDDPDSYVVYGPNGVILRNSSNTVSLTLSAAGISIKGNLSATGLVTGLFGSPSQVGLTTHVHVASGTPTTPPTPGT